MKTTKSSSSWKKMIVTTTGISVTLLSVLAVGLLSGSPVTEASDTHTDEHHRFTLYVPRIAVYADSQDHMVAKKQKKDFKQVLSTDTVVLTPTVLNLPEQRKFIEKSQCDKKVLRRFDDFVDRHQYQLAKEVWKYCSLKYPSSGAEASAYVDSNSPWATRLQDFAPEHRNVAILGDPSTTPNSIHGSFLYLRNDHRNVAAKMLSVIVDTELEVLEINPLKLSQELYKFVQEEIGGDKDTPIKAGLQGEDWLILEQICRMEPLRRTEETASTQSKVAHACPDHTGYCCATADVTQRQLVMMSKYPVLPYQVLPDLYAKPYNSETGHYQPDEVPFIATIAEDIQPRPPGGVPAVESFYDFLAAMEGQDGKVDCLPGSDACAKCLRDKKGANCVSCEEVCSCYCHHLCFDKPAERFVSKQLTVSPPLYRRDPNRFIPRIIHQTWFEELSRAKYPNMSRLVESFKRSGWEYKFYDDRQAANFISTHFPSEVREAYDALIPGAFKADLFRYCVLLIHGGVYADVDVHLESFLDVAIPSDIGFMVPIDEPGKPVHRQMCLWNGFIASAPGHPILAKAIETVTNQVRNRMTSVDMDATFCDAPELSMSHAYDTLFTAGPCLLGASVNRVLGRHPQAPHVAGEFDPWTPEQKPRTLEGTKFVFGAEDEPDQRLPGRTIVLSQNKWDMGAHRFTFVEQNLVLAATDLPDSNDRENWEEIAAGEGEEAEAARAMVERWDPAPAHYSQAHVRKGIYGVEGVYINQKRANEDIKIFVDLRKHVKE